MILFRKISILTHRTRNSYIITAAGLFGINHPIPYYHIYEFSIIVHQNVNSELN